MTGWCTYELPNGEYETVSWEGCFEDMIPWLKAEGAVRVWYTVDGSMPDIEDEPDLDFTTGAD